MTNPDPVPESSPALPRAEAGRAEPPAPPELILVSHSPLVYWWPVWAVGYVMAGLTWWYGQSLAVGDHTIRVHPDSSLGVLFLLTVFLVAVVSNVAVRGYASGMVVMGVITASVLLAYFGLWGVILGWFGDLNVFLNQGAYFWFSTLMLLVWAGTVFGIDRVTYWRVGPGQVTQVGVFGAASRSYDTENMVFEKHRDDLFKHWLLGLGSGDLRIQTYGARSEEIVLPNVLFVGSKVAAMQRLIAMEPTTGG